ncbi:MAG: carboxypeptidase regulatory-like domain-containing protein [Flavitalea sp.]
MKPYLLLLFAIQAMLCTACTKTDDDTVPDTLPPAARGIANGTVKYANGNPIANAQVVIENTVLYNSYVHATTNAQGFYSTAVPAGSWKPSVVITKEFMDHTYSFDLHPDNAAPFAGTSGGTRNFTWKLSGAKPSGGFYGANVGVYGEPGEVLAMEDVELTLTPDGLLADGSQGQIITRSLIDIGGGEDGICDVPIGKYIITAKNKSTNQSLQIRKRNTGEYAASYTGPFTSGFTGSTTYQIIIQVK